MSVQKTHLYYCKNVLIIFPFSETMLAVAGISGFSVSTAACIKNCANNALGIDPSADFF